MKLKQLEGYLSDVDAFSDPKVQLEQYPTTPHLASRILYTAESAFGDIEGKAVVDLGCGTGMLTIAAAMMGAEYALGIDVDPDALDIAHSNVSEFELQETVDLVNATLCRKSSDGLTVNEGVVDRLRGRFDTAVLNPPFGTKPGNKGIDVLFLQAACELAATAVYSLHKSSTRDYIVKRAKCWGFSCEVLAELKFNVPMMYKFHKKKSVDIEVDLLRLSRI